jgi:hypothetical protein
MTDNGWMVTWGRDHVNWRRGERQMSGDEERVKGKEPDRMPGKGTDGERKDGPGVDMMERGPTWVKDRVVERDEAAHEPLIWIP